jgi:hypothetical protein
MRKFFLLVRGILSLWAAAVPAQELPAADLSVGFSYHREGFSDGINANGGTPPFTGVFHCSPRTSQGSFCAAF